MLTDDKNAGEKKYLILPSVCQIVSCAMSIHKTFITTINDRCIVIVPSLGKIFEIDNSLKGSIPAFIESGDPLPVSRWDNLKDFQFLGVNFLLTNRCNLRCGYCYEDDKPCTSEAIFLKDEIIYAAIDYVAQCALEVGAPRIYANMFGGEPTLSFKSIQKGVNKLRSTAQKNGIISRATITTNGVMDKDKAIWLANNMDAITISFDGPPEIHNLHRSNSFDAVFKTAKTIFGIATQKISFRVTVSSMSVTKLPMITEFLGKNFPKSRIFIEPVFSIGGGINTKYGMPDHSAFFQGFLDSLPIAENYGCKIKTSILNIGAKSKQFCGAPGNNFMIAPDGRVSVCNRMVTNSNPIGDKFTYGKFDEKLKIFVFDAEKYNWLKTLRPNIIPACENCFASSNCRGDCVANKAIVDPVSFPTTPSYRCQEIREFIGKILLYIIDHGGEQIEWRE